MAILFLPVLICTPIISRYYTITIVLTYVRYSNQALISEFYEKITCEPSCVTSGIGRDHQEISYELSTLLRVRLSDNVAARIAVPPLYSRQIPKFNTVPLEYDD